MYNITVDVAHEYYANGVLVSNCDALRYPIFAVTGKRNLGAIEKPKGW